MTPAAQLSFGGIPDSVGEVVEVIASYLGPEAEVAMRWVLLVRLSDRAPGEPLVEPLVATVLETGTDALQDEIEQMWSNDSFRVRLTRDAYSAAVQRRATRRP